MQAGGHQRCQHADTRLCCLQSDGFNRPRNKLFLASEQSLGYLDGTLPGDFGFDPLGLSDPEAKPDAGAGEGFISPSWLAYAEVYHSRWAMLGAAGCIFPEIFAKLNIIPQTPAEVTWFRAGVIPPAGSYTYWTGGPGGPSTAADPCMPRLLCARCTQRCARACTQLQRRYLTSAGTAHKLGRRCVHPVLPGADLVQLCGAAAVPGLQEARLHGQAVHAGL